MANHEKENVRDLQDKGDLYSSQLSSLSRKSDWPIVGLHFAIAISGLFCYPTATTEGKAQ